MPRGLMPDDVFWRHYFALVESTLGYPESTVASQPRLGSARSAVPRPSRRHAAHGNAQSTPCECSEYPLCLSGGTPFMEMLAVEFPSAASDRHPLMRALRLLAARPVDREAQIESLGRVCLPVPHAIRSQIGSPPVYPLTATCSLCAPALLGARPFCTPIPIPAGPAGWCARDRAHACACARRSSTRPSQPHSCNVYPVR